MYVSKVPKPVAMTVGSTIPLSHVAMHCKGTHKHYNSELWSVVLIDMSIYIGKR